VGRERAETFFRDSSIARFSCALAQAFFYLLCCPPALPPAPTRSHSLGVLKRARARERERDWNFALQRLLLFNQTPTSLFFISSGFLYSLCRLLLSFSLLRCVRMNIPSHFCLGFFGVLPRDPYYISGSNRVLHDELCFCSSIYYTHFFLRPFYFISLSNVESHDAHELQFY
jgi:hypothetical protein